MALAAARQVVKPVLGAVNIAGDLGVPYIGGAASLLQGIQDSCEKVVVHREECRQLSKRAQEMLALFEEQSHKISESDLRIYVDEMENVLMGINRRMQRWARLGRFSAFLQDSKISQQIKASRLEIETQMNKFNFNSLMTIHDDGARTRALVEQQSVTIAELLHLVATRPSEGLDRIQRMEQDGEHIAGHVMEQGQQVLRQLREQDPTPQPQYQRRGTNSSQSSRITFMPQDPPERSQEYNELQHALGELYKRLRVLPQVQNLNGEVTRMGDIPVSGGTYSDVWIGEWMGEQKVALKALREVRTTANKAVKRFEREVKVWAGLDHPNILRFLGIVTNIGNFLQIVSPWQDNGNILDFVTKNPVTADRTHLLAGASKGLAYLHERKVVHGNLKCVRTTHSTHYPPLT
ncbi:hypothetical protein QCA50_007864 [Cerrena zonata]|uniref:Protein kinase domain-containing protein n=1 Tax=Cerrena zonata TaxID=2478898 RepID=A0AAW0G722_9APHY